MDEATGGVDLSAKMLQGMKTRQSMKTSTFKSASAAAAFEASYVDYQYIFVQFLIEHLCDVGAAFKGDYQSMLVLAVIGQTRLHAVRSQRDGLNDATDNVFAESCNATSISEIAGIPRQTVRRKLADLVDRGMVLAGGGAMLRGLDKLLSEETGLPAHVADDSLSAVDTRTESLIIEALESRRGRHTTIIVAHRLSTLRHADRILVLDHGRVEQIGTHESLVTTPGLYQRLWQIQGGSETSGTPTTNTKGAPQHA